jgi:hypothetical protein
MRLFENRFSPLPIYPWYCDNGRDMPIVSGNVLLKERLEEALHEVAPGFVRAVAKAKKEHADYVLIPFRAFRFEPDLFFRAIQYASMEGVPVLIVPENNQKRGQDEVS